MSGSPAQPQQKRTPADTLSLTRLRVDSVLDLLVLSVFGLLRLAAAFKKGLANLQLTGVGLIYILPKAKQGKQKRPKFNR